MVMRRLACAAGLLVAVAPSMAQAASPPPEWPPSRPSAYELPAMTPPNAAPRFFSLWTSARIAYVGGPFGAFLWKGQPGFGVGYELTQGLSFHQYAQPHITVSRTRFAAPAGTDGFVRATVDQVLLGYRAARSFTASGHLGVIADVALGYGWSRLETSSGTYHRRGIAMRLGLGLELRASRWMAVDLGMRIDTIPLDGDGLFLSAHDELGDLTTILDVFTFFAELRADWLGD